MGVHGDRRLDAGAATGARHVGTYMRRGGLAVLNRRLVSRWVFRMVGAASVLGVAVSALGGMSTTYGGDTVDVNDPPIAVDNSATVAANGTVTVLDSRATSVLANDSDPDRDALMVNLISYRTAGTVRVATDGTFAYTANGANHRKQDSFYYRVCDTCDPSLCAEAKVTITITYPDASLPEAQAVSSPGQASVKGDG